MRCGCQQGVQRQSRVDVCLLSVSLLVCLSLKRQGQQGKVDVNTYAHAALARTHHLLGALIEGHVGRSWLWLLVMLVMLQANPVVCMHMRVRPARQQHWLLPLGALCVVIATCDRGGGGAPGGHHVQIKDTEPGAVVSSTVAGVCHVWLVGRAGATAPLWKVTGRHVGGEQMPVATQPKLDCIRSWVHVWLAWAPCTLE